MELSELYCSKDVDQVIAYLKKYGIAIIQNYIGDDIESIKDEYNKVFELDDKSVLSKNKHTTNKNGIVVRLKRNRIDPSILPKIYNLFSSEFMSSVLNAFYNPHKSVLNDEIFFTHELPCEEPILPWHYDRVQSLKFFFYLKDTSVNDGAFEFAPGTHREGHYRANYYMSVGVDRESLPNDIPEDELINPLPITGSAGDLIIFDPGGFHRGGVVGPGGERLVMRGHSHPVYYTEGINKYMHYIKKALIKSPLNISRAFKSEYSRKFGDRIKSGESKRTKYIEELSKRRSTQ